MPHLIFNINLHLALWPQHTQQMYGCTLPVSSLHAHTVHKMRHATLTFITLVSIVFKFFIWHFHLNMSNVVSITQLNNYHAYIIHLIWGQPRPPSAFKGLRRPQILLFMQDLFFLKHFCFTMTKVTPTLQRHCANNQHFLNVLFHHIAELFQTTLEMLPLI